MSFLDELNNIVPDFEEGAEVMIDTVEEVTVEAPDSYFKSFKNIRGQFFQVLKEIKEEAYTVAYNAYMAKPETQIKLSKISDDDVHRELKEAEIEAKAHEYADKEAKKARPAKPLSVAIMLKKYIRFIRVKPEGKGQEAPLYFYHPDKGIYECDDQFLQDLIVVIFPECTEKQARDVLFKIAHSRPMKKANNHYSAIGGQLYNSKTGEFEAFNPSIITVRKIKTGYNPKATEPDINGWKPTAWLKELFDSDDELYRLAIQIIKATVTGESLQKIFWLYGEGGTGKGTFQQLLINLAGMENTASLKITGLEKSRFSTSILIGKSLVIGDDVQKDAVIKDTADMFSLVTGDIMTIEDKGKRPYSTRFNVTVVQSSNGLPRMNGDKEAISRRFTILPFTKVFKRKPNKAIKADYINRKDVLEYLVKLAIETPQEDLNPLKSIELLEEHQKDINPVLDFIDQFFNDDLVSEFIPNSYIFHIWKDFLKYYDIRIYKSERGLHREIKNNLPDGFRAGSRNIEAGRQLAVGFFPKADRPIFATTPYFNGRESPEQQKTRKTDRGYFNYKARNKKKRKKLR